MAHRHGARVLVDGAQAVSHMPVDVQALDCDFYVFSGHKIFAPTGIGVLFGKADVLDTMPPWQGGGNMIADVTFEKTTYQPPPLRFEAGTGSIADAVGLGAALDYVSAVGLENVEPLRARALACTPTERLARVPGLHLIGTRPGKGRAFCRSCSTDSAPRTSAGRSTRRASPCAPGTIALSRSCAASAWRARSVRRSRSTTPAKTSTPWSMP